MKAYNLCYFFNYQNQIKINFATVQQKFDQFATVQQNFYTCLLWDYLGLIFDLLLPVKKYKDMHVATCSVKIHHLML